MPETPQPAAPTVGDVLAMRLRRFRKERNLSVPQLADLCLKLGVPELTTPSITNLERPAEAKRPRRRATVEEWLTLAIALNVPPPALIAPAGESPSVAVTPERVVSTGDFVDWLAHDDQALVALGDNLVTRQVSALALARWFHRCAVVLANLSRFPGVDVAELVREFLAVRAEISRRGEVEPALPEGKEALVNELIDEHRPSTSVGVRDLFSRSESAQHWRPLGGGDG